MSKNVCVLLSTYNGERYLREQIDSILTQIDVSVELLVRDDGSTDKTVDIINEYKNQHKNITFLDSYNNLGAANSFMELLYESIESDYYAFADQDDIWLPEKLTKAIKIIEQKEIDRGPLPVLYASNQILYYGDGKKELRFKKAPNTTLTGIICGNQISGCTMMFNKELRDILIAQTYKPTHDVLRLRMHDTWVAAVAASCGVIAYDANSYILYRIHENNTVGIDAGAIQKRISRTLGKIKKSDQRNGRSRFARELLKISNIDQNSRKIIRKFANSKKNRVEVICDKDIRRDCPENRTFFILKSILGWN